MTKKKNGSMGMVNMGVTNLVGVGLVGATAGMVNDMPAGTAKSIAGMAPALQSTALMGANLGMMKKSMGSKKNSYF
jgi:hypothetical protein